MRYSCIAIQTDENDFMWAVHETATDQIIDSFIFEDEAQDYCAFLQSGGGFNGFTPSFMLNEVFLPLDINEHFILEVAP